jgi:UTP:GlnB (protein PII) uridylyltransferase
LEELFERTEAFLEAQNEELSGAETSLEEPALTAAAISLDSHLASVRRRLGRQLATRGRNGSSSASHRILSAKPGTEIVSEELRARIQEHVDAMPAAYLLNTPLETIRLHLDLVAEWQEIGGVVLDMRTAMGSGTGGGNSSGDGSQTELTVVTRDDAAPGLLAKITGALFACDINLHSAQVFTRDLPGAVRLVIDTLRVDFRERVLSPDKRVSVEEALQTVLNGDAGAGELLSRRRKTVPDGRAVRAFHIDAAASSDYTLVDIEAVDEEGLIYFLASLFTGLQWNIHAARISTWGGSVRCAFYLTDAAGNHLPEDTALDSLWRAIAASRQNG